MRESTIPPNIRFTRMTENGIAVEISRNWQKELYDYENQGSIEYLQVLKNRDSALPVGKDSSGCFCKKCNSETSEEENFCWYCGQRLKGE